MTSAMKSEKYLEYAEQRFERDGMTDRAKMDLALGIGWALLGLLRAYRGDDEEGGDEA